MSGGSQAHPDSQVKNARLTDSLGDMKAVPAISSQPNFADVRGRTPTTGAMPAAWSGVFAMSLCVFALIASEFMPVSLLTPIASQLRITEGMAGQGVAMSGAFAVLTSLSIAALSRNLNRKTLLLGLTAAMCLSGAVVGLARDYTTYLIGRALIGVVVGGFWSMSAATAMRLVPLAEVPRALAIFNGGNALATIVAAPLGSYLGAGSLSRDLSVGDRFAQRVDDRRQGACRVTAAGVVGVQAGEGRTPLCHHLLQVTRLDMGPHQVFREEGQAVA